MGGNESKGVEKKKGNSQRSMKKREGGKGIDPFFPFAVLRYLFSQRESENVPKYQSHAIKCPFTPNKTLCHATSPLLD